MEDYIWWEKFESYYRKEMNSEERAEFELALKENPELKKQFDEYLRVVNALSCIATREKLAANPEFRKAIAIGLSDNRGTPFLKKWGFPILALLLVILFSVWWFFLRAEATESKQEPMSIIELAEAGEIDFRDIAIEFAENSPLVGDITRSLPQDSRSNEIREIFGNCHDLLLKAEFTRTIECIETHPELIQRSEYSWFLGLAYLGKGELSKAIDLIEGVADNRFNDYFPLARELQERLIDN